MEKRILGKTGLAVSPLTIGTWQLAGPVTFDGKPDGHPDPGRKSVLKMIAQLHEAGVNAIDTAEQYGDGEGERRTGEAIRGHRDDWIVSTKFGYRVGHSPDGTHQTRIDDSSPGTILASLEGSLKRLETDYIDIFLYHCAPDLSDIAEAAAILEKAKQQGKARFTGISTDRLDLLEALHQHGILDVVQFPTSLLHPATEVSAFVKEHNVGTQLRGIMANGRLSGKYLETTPTWHPDDHRGGKFSATDFAAMQELAALLPATCTLDQAALQWSLRPDHHHTVCLGAKTLTDAQSSIAALDQSIDSEIIDRLEKQAAMAH